MKTNTYNYLLMIAISLIVTCLTLIPVIYKFYKTMPKVGVVDIQAIVVENQNQWIQQMKLNNGNVSDSQREVYLAETKSFAAKLEKAVDTVNAECDCILINKAALLTNSNRVVDYTNQVRGLTKK